ncbi:hypothetical protein [Bacillus sp. JJ722]|uniref:hypothetical protein n=1 Tax=Bacillus sp. JJ722 TaxID=3122973 RepID=UPI002FFD63A0
MNPIEEDIAHFKHLEPIELDVMYIVKGLETKTREHLLKRYKEDEILSLKVPEGNGYIGYAYKCVVIFADEPNIEYNYIYLDGEILQVSTTPIIQSQKGHKHLNNVHKKIASYETIFLWCLAPALSS